MNFQYFLSSSSFQLAAICCSNKVCTTCVIQSVVVWY